MARKQIKIRRIGFDESNKEDTRQAGTSLDSNQNKSQNQDQDQKKDSRNKTANNSNSAGSYSGSNLDRPLEKTLKANLDLFKDIFRNNDTLIIRRFENRYLPEAKCCVLYFEGMINPEILNENIIQPILKSNLNEGIDRGNLLEELQNKIIVSGEVKMVSKVDEVVPYIIYGDTVLFVEGYDHALVINSKGWKTRDITEPESSKIVRGPREGFTESIVINLSLLRRKIKNENLKMKFKEIGAQTRTKTCICYIEGIALQEIVDELEKRLDDINLDGILDSGYIQEFLDDEPLSPFQTVGSTERPDIAAGKILEGRVALFVDGSPFVLTVPYIFAESVQANEDYYNNFYFASIMRIFRNFSFIFSISIPALYNALTTFHHEMIPTPLLISISASRQGVPFPTILSMFVMLLVFDILREAGTRMPAQIGQAVNIVGTLVLGQAAVEAKLVSAPIVIITALTGISTLMNITLIGPVIIFRFFLLFLSGILGIYGYIFGILAIIIHLMNIRSFGVPYLMNNTSVKNYNGQDIWIRAPWWSMTMRPKIIGAKNMIRQKKQKSRGGRQ